MDLIQQLKLQLKLEGLNDQKRGTRSTSNNRTRDGGRSPNTLRLVPAGISIPKVFLEDSSSFGSTNSVGSLKVLQAATFKVTVDSLDVDLLIETPII